MSARVRRTVPGRRLEILDATVELIERVGLGEVRVGDVAETLGVSNGLVYYHFGDKDSLLAAAFAHAFDRDLADMDAAVVGSDPLVKLGRVARLFDGPDAPVGWQIWIDACAVAHREPMISEVMRRIDRQYAARMRSVLEEGVAAGVFACPDPAASVERIFALNDGLSTAVAVLESVSRTQLRTWMTNQIAVEAGVDPVVLVRHSRPEVSPGSARSPRHGPHSTD